MYHQSGRNYLQFPFHTVVLVSMTTLCLLSVVETLIVSKTAQLCIAMMLQGTRGVKLENCLPVDECVQPCQQPPMASFMCWEDPLMERCQYQGHNEIPHLLI